jgi:hypothetical protein
MLQKARDFFTGSLLPADFAKKAAPPKNTPDLCLLEQQEFHLMFDWDNRVRSPIAIKDVYTEQKFFMYAQNHINGTPPLAFSKPPCYKRHSLGARLSGKLHLVPTKDMVALDKMCLNHVESIRRKIKIVLPFFRETGPRYNAEARTPLTYPAWVYFDNHNFWKPKFQFDFEIWRGRRDSAFLSAKTKLCDWREHVRYAFAPAQRPAHQPRLSLGFFDMDAFKRALKLEHNSYQAELKENPIKQVEWPERKFLILNDVEFSDPETPTVPQLS